MKAGNKEKAREAASTVVTTTQVPTATSSSPPDFHLFSGWSNKEFTAEVFGTFLMMVIGNSMSAIMALKRSNNVLAGGYVGGLGAMIGIMATLPISGGHINPAVTIAFACTGRTAWSKVPHYLIGQYIGSFLAQLCVYGMFFENIRLFDSGVRSAYGSNTSTGQIFVTFPAQHVSLGSCVASEIIASTMLLIGVCAIIDSKGCNVPSYLQPFLIAGWICAVGSSLGINTGAVLNPARDLAPRVFTTLIGYGAEAFQPQHGHYWYAVGVLAPHFGALLGVLLYDHIIGRTLADREDDEHEPGPSSYSHHDRASLVENMDGTAMDTFSVKVPVSHGISRKNSKAIKGLYVTICENGSEISRSKDSAFDDSSFEKHYTHHRSTDLGDGSESKNVSHDYYYVMNNIPKISYTNDVPRDASSINNDHHSPSLVLPAAPQSPYHSSKSMFDNNARRRSSRTLHSVNSEFPKKD